MTDDGRVPPWVLPALVVLLLVTVLAVGTGADDGASQRGVAPSDADVIVLEDGSRLWPYTSREPDVGERTLPINLVVYGDPALTESMLRAASTGDWEDVVSDRQDVAPAEDVGGNATTIGWRGADGATRWTHAASPAGQGVWLRESYQLHDGDFLGSRHHVRGYVDPVGDDWTAMQAHREHWDWFHVRHTVHGVESSQSHVEAEFLDRPYLSEVHREHLDNRGADADGWVTIVVIDSPVAYALGVLLVGSFGAARRADVRERFEGFYADETVRTLARSLLVVAALVCWYVAVRTGGIAAERALPDLSPWVVVWVLYPVLVGGMPVAAYLSARRLDSTHAFAAGSLGFTLAVLLDYTYLGVAVLPIETIVHRAALAVALGFTAAGASRTARATEAHRGHVRTGVLLWLVAVAIPFLQFV